MTKLCFRVMYIAIIPAKVGCATELLKHNIDEQLIMKQTGHRSQDASKKV